MTLPDLHPDAVALAAARVLPGGELRQYTATTFPDDPWRGCNRIRRVGAATGMLAATAEFDGPGLLDSYAVMDVLNDHGDIVQDFAIPTQRAFGYWRQKLSWAVLDVADEQRSHR